VLRTIKAIFTRSGAHSVWSTENPHAARYFSFQQRFSVNIWAGILHDFAVGLYEIHDRHNVAHYAHFHDEALQIFIGGCASVLAREYLVST
jgi:hypothetical protein